MPRLKQTVRWRDVSGGVLQKVSSDLSFDSAIPHSINMLFDEYLGEAITRKGTDIVGSQMESGETCSGLYNHLDTTPGNSKLFAVFNGTIYNVLTGSSMETGLTAANKSYFSTFLNNTLLLNGAEARSYSNAGGWISSGGDLDLSNIPSNVKYPLEWKDRMYCVADDYIYFSTNPNDGSISWSDAGSGSTPVEREDGGGLIQGLGKVPAYVLIFKERSLKRWNTQATFPEDMVRLGTQSQASVVNAKGRAYFAYGPNGFYETNGNEPTLISRPIQRIVDGISDWSEVYGWSDDEHVYWSVGNVTMDFDRGYMETYANVVVRYTIRSQQWAPLSYGNNFSFFHQYVSGGTGTAVIVGGDDDGNVLQLNTGTTDYNGGSGLAINYILQSPEIDFDNRGKVKTVSQSIIVHHDTGRGAELQARLDYGEWKSVGNVDTDIVAEVEIEPQTANVFEYRLVDSIIGEQVKLRGLDFPNIFLSDRAKMED